MSNAQSEPLGAIQHRRYFMLPPRLVVPFYVDRNPHRQAELDAALMFNLAIPFIGEFLIVCEGQECLEYVTPKLATASRCKVICVQSRPTFRQLIEIANEEEQAQLSISPDLSTFRRVTMLINTDIALGQNMDLAVRELWRESSRGTQAMLVMSRYELASEYGEEPRLYMQVGGGSHDLWGWVGCLSLPETVGNFYMGRIHCDGIFAMQMWQLGFSLKNPCLDAHIIHMHKTNIRNYSQANIEDYVKGSRLGVTHRRIADPWDEADYYDDGTMV